MNKVYKAVTYIFVSLVLSLFSAKIQSGFVDKFAENILALLTTLFAINIASSTLIAGKVREIQDKTGVQFLKTKYELKRSFYFQIVLVFISFIIGILRESKICIISINVNYLKLICDTILFYCFISYVDIIKDIGQGLFSLLDFSDKNK